MNVVGRKKIVLLGLMTRMPVAGVVWQTVHYLEGFRRLGYEPYYVEAHGITPTALMATEDDDGPARAAAFVARVMARFDLGQRWAYHDLHGTGRCYGMTREELDRLYRSAELIINLHGGTIPLAEHSATGRLIYLETDPVELQMELHNNLQAAIDFLEPHVAFFTFGENYGHPECGLPLSERFQFKPTRQPVVCDFWDRPEVAPGPAFTTIGNWRQAHRPVVLNGEVYHWSKHLEFQKFLDLPRRTGATFELGLCSFEDEDRRLLEGAGWRIRPAADFSDDIDSYRRYIKSSRGEFTVAKDQNVRLRTGWFSDRSATYLASGRPVITQDTGFGRALPTGAGLFAFTTMDEAVFAVEAVQADYGRHAAAARAVGREWFEAVGVLGRMLSDVFTYVV